MKAASAIVSLGVMAAYRRLEEKRNNNGGINIS
jgi:hypothetical protein